MTPGGRRVPAGRPRRRYEVSCEPGGAEGAASPVSVKGDSLQPPQDVERDRPNRAARLGPVRAGTRVVNDRRGLLREPLRRGWPRDRQRRRSAPARWQWWPGRRGTPAASAVLAGRGLAATRPFLVVGEGESTRRLAVATAFHCPLAARRRVHRTRSVQGGLSDWPAATVRDEIRACPKATSSLTAAAALVTRAHQLERTRAGSGGSRRENPGQPPSVMRLALHPPWPGRSGRQTPRRLPESSRSTVRLRNNVTKWPASGALRLTKLLRPITAAEDQWRYVNGPHLASLRRVRPTFRTRVLIERSGDDRKLLAGAAHLPDPRLPVPRSEPSQEPARPDASPSRRLRPMPLAELRVTNLFGHFTHRIALNEREHITIMHGANGVGKTTILRLIDDFFRGRFSALGRIPFSTIEMGLTSGELLTLTRVAQPASGSRPSSFRLTAALTRGRRKSTPPFELYGPTTSDTPFPPGAVSAFLPWLEQVGPHEWYDTNNTRLVDFQDLLDEYGHMLPFRHDIKERPKWLNEFRRSLSVHIIETQRLSAQRREPQPGRRLRSSRELRPEITAVQLLSEDLASKIRGVLASYAERSQELDRSFPFRVLADSESPSLDTDAAIRERYEKLGNIRTRLMTAGVLDPGEDVGIRTNLSDTERKVLWTYLGDVEKKLEVLTPLADKIDLFREILNAKFIGKQVTVGRQDGFQVVSVDNHRLSPEFLSSGEQHELVLAYRLLFDVDPGSLILIDEPELSLHVSWQQMFLPDLERISQTAKLDFLVATHSPTIIGNRWDLTTQLATPET